MKQLLIDRGWIPNGGCSSCGVQNWIHPDYGDCVLKTKNMSAYKIVKGGKDLFPYSPMNGIGLKLDELEKEVV